MDSQKPKRMRIRNLKAVPHFSYQLLIFFIELFILFACIQYAQLVYNNDILPDKMVEENYPQVSCVILSKKLGEEGHLLHRYRAEFLVSYMVNNTPYRTWVTGNGLDQAFFRERAPQEEILAQFEVGASYPCWYNPGIPQIAVLVIRHDWASTLPLAVPAIIGLITLYYLLKNSLQFFGRLLTFISDRTKFKK